MGTFEIWVQILVFIFDYGNEYYELKHEYTWIAEIKALIIHSILSKFDEFADKEIDETNFVDHKRIPALDRFVA